jgi:hypothetical protein
MGKRKTPQVKSGSKYTSQGQRPNVARSVLKAVRLTRSYSDELINKLAAWKRKENPWVTVENSNKNAKNKKIIRVRANDHFGDPDPRKEKKEKKEEE